VALNGFDKIAFIYDFLAKLVFGKSIIHSQKYFLSRIPDHSKIVILGGGTGWLLAELLKVKPNCEVWYIEASEKMIALSRNKINTEQAIHFIHGTQLAIPLSLKYDVVITNFYLDLFTDRQLADVAKKIRSSLKPGSLWIATDFVCSRRWQKMLLKIMYRFFRITCNIESQQLPEWNNAIQRVSLIKIESIFFYKDFIQTILYQL